MLSEWGMFFLLSCGVICLRKIKRIPKIYAVTFLYVLTLSISVFCFRALGFNSVQQFHQSQLLATSLFNAFTLLVSVCLIEYLTDKIDCAKTIEQFLPLLSIVSALLLLIANFKIVDHASSAANFIVIGLVPTLTKVKKEKSVPNCFLCAFHVGLVLLTLLKVDATVPLLVFFVITIVFTAKNVKNKKYVTSAFVIMVCLISIVLFKFGLSHILDDGQRFKAYKIFLGHQFNDSLPIQLFGYGPGSFEVVSQLIQYKTRFLINVDPNGNVTAGWLWLHMHSDWLQFIFEYGIVGFLLIIATTVTLHNRIRDNEMLLILFYGCATSMVFDFPLRYPLLPLLTIFLFASSLQHKPRSVLRYER